MTKEKERILLVDDDPFVAEMLAILLEEEGYTVEVVDQGREALEVFARHPDTALILTDMQMPGMDGLELTRELRRSNDSVPILVLSARDDGEFRRLALESGARGCLVKDEDLLERIAGVVAEVLQGQPTAP
ncbi:response regulator [bacterium]|nr:response regulator [bacterium]